MKQYICIDLKSFYASVECVERGLDPLNTNLVVADITRTEKTICLAITPSLKSYGIPGRARLFEVNQKVKEINHQRQIQAPFRQFQGSSYLATELSQNSGLKLDFLIAAPQMAHYMEISTKIYGIYLQYVSPEDVHVYSIDEVFIDVTPYLQTYHCTAHELAMRMIRSVLKETGITATAGIGTNLYLAKIAMDIVAKKIPADKDGVRIAELNELSYREKLWDHTPITDFWRVGKGIANRLSKLYLYTMGDICQQSITNDEVLYRTFGKNAELLIDHAWGYEPCTIAEIKAYQPMDHSISQGQVLSCAYEFEKARLVCREMADQVALDLVRKGIVCDQIVLTIGYDTEGVPDTYQGEWEINRYGRRCPKTAHGSINLPMPTASSHLITSHAMTLFDQIVHRQLQVRRLYVVANHVKAEQQIQETPIQYGLFDDVQKLEQKRAEEKKQLEREKKLQNVMISLKEKYGKNSVFKGMDLEEGATARERNEQVGGHKA